MPVKRALVLVSVALGASAGVIGCAQVLGGLDEATEPAGNVADAGSTDASPESAPDAKPRSPWLSGFAHRLAFAIDSREPTMLAGFTMKLGFDMRALVEAKKVRADGADLRVTNADGVTVAPHWIQSGQGGEATTLWAKLDVPPGASTAFLYYGNDVATPTASLRDTFIEGIIVNGAFDRGSSPWTEVAPTSGGTSTLRIQGGRAEVTFGRPVAATAPSSVGWCQPVTFPPGHAYRLVVDQTTLLLGGGHLAMWAGPVVGEPIWTHVLGVGHERGVDSERIDAGATQVCVGARLRTSSTPQNVSGQFENVRVRLYAEHEPIAGPAGPEERP